MARIILSSRLAAAVASGVLLSLAHPPADLGVVAWLALVPLLIALRGRSRGSAALLGWVCGATFFSLDTSWIAATIGRHASLPPAVPALLSFLVAAILGCYVAAFGVAARSLDRPESLWVAPAAWVTLEWMRGWLVIGFPWNAFGASQHRALDVIQIAEVTGVYGVSALLVLANVVAARGLTSRPGGRRRAALPLAALAALVALVVAGGRWRVASLRTAPGEARLRVALVQGNVAEERKWDPAFSVETLDRYVALTEKALAAKPDLVVWPETATPFFFQDPGRRRDRIVDLARRSGVALLFGSPAWRREPNGDVRQLNRAYLLSPQGRNTASYDKIRLVPFGEYVPFERTLFFVRQLVPTASKLAPGRESTVFELPGGRFGVLICYEGIFPDLARRLVGAGAEFLVNVTNDAWFAGTAAPRQHLAQVVLRAVENRVPIVRAANTGISAFIDFDGTVRWQGPLDEAIWKDEEIRLPNVRTVYARFGDLFVYGCVLACAARAATSRRRRLT